MADGTSPIKLSVIVVVRDNEDSIGRDVRGLAQRLREREWSFEIIATSDGSYDTSLTILHVLHAEIPELRVLGMARPGRAFRRAMVHAKGQAVLLWEADRGDSFPHAILGWALSQLSRRDAVVVRGRFVLARTGRAMTVLLATSGRGNEYEARFERHAARLGLDLEIVGRRVFRPGRGLLAPVMRILSV